MHTHTHTHTHPISAANTQLRTLRKYCEWLELAELKDGSTVLDMGCGWGSFTLYAAEHFPKLKFTAVSNSSTQREYIMGKAAAKGIRNVEVKTLDLGKEDNLERLCSELKGSVDQSTMPCCKQRRGCELCSRAASTIYTNKPLANAALLRPIAIMHRVPFGSSVALFILTPLATYLCVQYFRTRVRVCTNPFQDILENHFD